MAPESEHGLPLLLCAALPYLGGKGGLGGDFNREGGKGGDWRAPTGGKGGSGGHATWVVTAAGGGGPIPAGSSRQ